MNAATPKNGADVTATTWINVHRSKGIGHIARTNNATYMSYTDEWQSHVDPIIARYLLPPCGLRKMTETRPICPEGDRYCGVPVWNTFPNAERRL